MNRATRMRHVGCVIRNRLVVRLSHSFVGPVLANLYHPTAPANV